MENQKHVKQDYNSEPEASNETYLNTLTFS